MKSRRNFPYIYVTWITGIMAGDFQCEWASWFRANFQDFDKIQKDGNLAVWKAQHGEMLRLRAETLKTDGWTVYVEGQNKLTVKGRAATLGGVCDIVAVRGDDTLVIDCKTGKAKDGDIMQVLIYMMVLPMAHHACRGRSVRGEVQYRDGSVQLPNDMLTEQFRALAKTTIERMASLEPLNRIPSFGDCRFCDIGSDCDERIKEETVAVETDSF